MENLTPVDNQAQETPVSAVPATPTSGWKDSLSGDLKNSPLLQKFDNTAEGLGKAFESHANLEKLLGNEKVPIPKGDNDFEGWARFSKAMGIPDKPEAYGLKDAQIPDSLKGMSIDKNKFAEVMHSHKATPSQAKGMWDVYQKLQTEAYSKAVEAHQNKVTEGINALRSEWGPAYDNKVELGQSVINQFSEDQETSEYLTAALVSDPKGVKFLARLGEQFAENKVGNFNNGRFTKTPAQAAEELAKIRKDPNHPYMNQNATESERQQAISYVNSLHAIVLKGQA